MKKSVSFAFLFTGISSCSLEETVHPLGDDDFDSLPPPATCQVGDAARFGRRGFVTIQDALNAASGGGTVTICAGSHQVLSTLVYANVGPLHVVGETGFASDVILDGNFSNLIWSLPNGSSRVRFEDITFTRGVPTFGSAAAIDSFPGVGRTDLISCVFANNSASDSGVVDFQGVRHNIINTIFDNNIATSGVSALKINVYHSLDQFINIIDSGFYNGSGYSGAVQLAIGGTGGKTLVKVIDSTFENNINQGGATLEVQSTLYRNSVVIEGSRFVSNRSPGPSAALHVFSRDGDTTLGIRSSSFDSNMSSASSAIVLDHWPCSPIQCATNNIAIFEDTSIVSNNSRRNGAFSSEDHWKTTWRSVDLGLGPTNNIGGDINGCNVDLGQSTNGITDPAVGDHCP